MNSSWRIIALNPDRKIGGVWRLKDDKKFFLGDKTFFGIITEFSIREGKVQVKCGTSPLYGMSEITHSNLVSLEYLS